MTDDGFEARVRTEGPGTVIDLLGLIDGQAEAALNNAYAQAAAATDLVVLNFADVGYINSTGIALVVGLLAQARRSRNTVRACGLSDHYREIFEITRLADFMPIHSDETSAMAAGV
ncbi:MAG TPA: STAS domain-containing protein [Actinomycetota bacterium]|nr:STAS domain-containing protein [Vitreimonas sp.]HVL80797.1 STAS domain-containing protein [Actinomycetota bacterium]